MVFPLKINSFVAALLHCTGVKEVKLETMGRNEVRLNFTLLYVSCIERSLDENNDAGSYLTYLVYFPHSSMENASLLENARYQMHTVSLGHPKVRRPLFRLQILPVI